MAAEAEAQAPRRRRRRLRRRRRDRARRADDERLVAARAHALHALARARHPRRRDAGDGDRARRRARLRRSRRARTGLTELAGGRRGLHVLVRARGDAGRPSSTERQSAAGRAADELQAALETEPPGLRSQHEQQDSPRRHGARQRSARARADRLGVRDPDTTSGEIKVAAARKRLFAPRIQTAVPAWPAPAGGVVRDAPRAPPEAARGAAVHSSARPCSAATLASAVTVQAVRRSTRLGAVARELALGALSLAPALLALRGGELAAYHGAEHVSIGTYEHGEKRAKEHERCGSHLIGPLLAAVGRRATCSPARTGAPAQARRGPSARSAPSAPRSRSSRG